MNRLTIEQLWNRCDAVCEIEGRQGKVHGDTYKEYSSFRHYLKELQHYKDLEEQGRLIELPCKVGDTVWTYTVSHGKYEIYDVEVVHEVFATHVKRLWGDRFFATKEEAEEALKRLQGNE